MLLLPSDRYKHPLLAKHQAEQGKAVGRRCTVQFRAWTQQCLDRLAQSIHRKTQIYFILLLLALCIMFGGFKALVPSTDFNQLWVESGGRLETEMGYTEKVLEEKESISHLLITQIAKEGTSPEVPRHRLLHKKSLQLHMLIIKAIIRVTILLYDVTWSIKDICVSPTPPTVETMHIDNIFDAMMPCEIITALDCFWEGSKLMGPDIPVTIPGFGTSIKWTNLNPQSILKTVKATGEYPTFPFDVVENYMKRGGINSGYQDKLCLDPDDPECPDTAPNKKSKKIPDIGVELANGCRGFSSKYMHWPKELLLGSITYNRSGYIQNAEALQTVIPFMGAKEFHDYWAQSYKIMHIASWDQEKAALVIKTWQKKCIEEIKKLLKTNDLINIPYSFNTFSTILLDDLLSQYDFLNAYSIYIGLIIMVIYVSIMHIDISDALRSQSFIALCSVLLVILSIISGIGFLCLIGIQIHSVTISVVVSIALAVGVNIICYLLSSYKRISGYGPLQTNWRYVNNNQVSIVLRSAGFSIIITSFAIISIFTTAAIVPIPALRELCLSVAVLVIFILVTTIFGVTCLISIDMRRRRSGRIDIFCCFPSLTFKWPFSNRTNYSRTASTYNIQMDQVSVGSDLPTPASSNLLSKDSVDLESECKDVPVMPTETICCSWKAKSISQKYAQYLVGPYRPYVVVLFILILVISICGIIRIQEGLTLPEMVPDGTNEQKFLETYGPMFGFYNVYAVTRDNFEYPTNQKILYDYHDAFMRVPNILKNENGGLPQMWLTLFREWLLGLQRAFDKDWTKKCIGVEGWDSCASENGILGYKLLVQTGNNDNPIDKSLVSSARLVDEYGIINEETFYNLLTAWASNDILAYGASQANIRPEPRHWLHVAKDFDLQIVKSSPIIYAQMPFYASNLHETSTITKFLSTVRSICKQFDERGLPNYPSGLPFTYWEQYQDIHKYFCVSMTFAFLFLFVNCGLLLCNVRAVFMVLFMSATYVIQTLGFMGFVNLKFSAITIVLLIGSVGTGVVFTIHMSLSFITCIGNKQKRAQMAVDHMAKVVLQSGATLIIAAIMLVFQNNYVSRSYLLISVAQTIFGLLNGLVFLPVFLSMFGPPPEITPLKYPDRISTPSPEPPIKRKKKRHIIHYNHQIQPVLAPPRYLREDYQQQLKAQKEYRRRRKQQKKNSTSRIRRHYKVREGSLSTIPEESGSYRSSSIGNRMETHMETEPHMSRLSRSPSPSSQSDYSTDSGSENDTPQRTQSVPIGSAPSTRCVVTAKFELELDGNVMSAAAQPCVHKSSSKHHHNNRQPKRHKCHRNTRY